MKLHENITEFRDLISLTASEINIPESAVERDYFIVRALMYLSQSENNDQCVFKGGTSLSKCYPGSIDRFSEDIDLSYIPKEGMTDKQIERKLKSVEETMTTDSETEIISIERNKRNKSIWFWYKRRDNKIKLEIGSSVRPEPYSIKTIKTFIQQYLERHNHLTSVKEYDLKEVTINALSISRTFIDKIMAVKRHSICGSIPTKARHIYDVYRLLQMKEIKDFLRDQKSLKHIVELTKKTDTVYLEKRTGSNKYDPTVAYDFDSWKNEFMSAKDTYETLHEDLLFTNDKQSFEEAIVSFEYINSILSSIGE